MDNIYDPEVGMLRVALLKSMTNPDVIFVKNTGDSRLREALGSVADENRAESWKILISLET